MEDTLGGLCPKHDIKLLIGLNPCFNGRYSRSDQQLCWNRTGRCLNPCFNGRYSRSTQNNARSVRISVLILVLMEDTLGESLIIKSIFWQIVLILVLMEDTLGEHFKFRQ